MVDTITPIDSAIEELRKKIHELQSEREERIRQTRLVCRHCGARVAIGDTVYVQNHFYEPPSFQRNHRHVDTDSAGPTDSHWECGCGTANLITPDVAKLAAWFRAVRHERYW